MSFADYPPSLREVRAHNADDPAAWTPREALISMLRSIDSGESSPEHVVIAYSRQLDGRSTFEFVQAGNLSSLAQAGLLHAVANDILTQE